MTMRFIEPDRADPRLAAERRYTMTIGGRSVNAASGKTIRRESSVHPGLIVGEWPEASPRTSSRQFARRAGRSMRAHGRG